MTSQDAKILAQFIAKMGMYICPSDRPGVVAFIHGYESGSLGRCTFTRFLAEELTEKHRIHTDCLGWPEQIERLAIRLGVGWMEAFIMGASGVLTKSLDSKGAGRRKPKRRRKHTEVIAEPGGPGNSRREGRLTGL